MIARITILMFWLISVSAQAESLNFKFGNPAFSGDGYSSHVLSIEQLQYSRDNDIKADAKSAASALERANKNTTINKFISNVESRIYANLSKQLVDNMFGTTCDSETTTCPTSGTANVEGSVIYWVKDATSGNITLTVTATDGAVTTLTVPVGDFVF
tara:strand:- start:683 stop:1153 length:471 start_codon:yes stop_codon:yes gene_type:complete